MNKTHLEPSSGLSISMGPPHVLAGSLNFRLFSLQQKFVFDVCFNNSARRDIQLRVRPPRTEVRPTKVRAQADIADTCTSRPGRRASTAPAMKLLAISAVASPLQLELVVRMRVRHESCMGRSTHHRNIYVPKIQYLNSDLQLGWSILLLDGSDRVKVPLERLLQGRERRVAHI